MLKSGKKIVRMNVDRNGNDKKRHILQDSMEGGVWNMVEEMIREIRTAEKQADEIVKEAREKSAEIAQQTEEEAQRIEKEITEKAGQTAKALALQAEERVRQKEEEAGAVLAKEIRELKASSEKKKEEASDLVISLLVSF